MQNSYHISVCICTYKRPAMLAHLLDRLERQITDNLFTYSIVIVDNDCHESAKEIVSAIKQNERFHIDYFSEPEQNISLARNKAVQNANGNLIAFIDDDEFPEDKWLLSLFKAYKSFNVTGVLGPVLPRFEEPPPNWIKKGNYFKRNSLKTGVVLNWKDTRTGNLLIVRDIFNVDENRFDESFGKTGGEDTDFFKRLIEKGCRFVWCSEAVIYETVPPERWEIRCLLLRALRTGGIYAKLHAKGKPFLWKSFFTLKYVTMSFTFLLVVPFSYMVGKHILIRCLMKVCSNIGKITGVYGYVYSEYV